MASSQMGSGKAAPLDRFGQNRWLVILLFVAPFVGYAIHWMLQLTGPEVAVATSARAKGSALLWLVTAGAILALTFGRGSRRRFSPRQREVLNDELTAADRASAAGVGYAMLLAGLAAISAAQAMGLSRINDLLRIAPTLLLSLGVVVPAIVFALRQRLAEPNTEEGA